MTSILLPVIYVAGPYSADTISEIEANIKRAELDGIALMNNGWSVHIPHKNTAFMGSHKALFVRDWQTWLARDFAILRRCDAVFLMHDWRESRGACAEWGFATGAGIPIHYAGEGYPEGVDA